MRPLRRSRRAPSYHEGRSSPEAPADAIPRRLAAPTRRRETESPMTSQPPPTTRQPSSEADIRKYTIGELKPHDAPIRLVDYDPAWPGLFEREAARIRGVLAERVLELEH